MGYPDAVQPFLLSDEHITSDAPEVVDLAQQILASVPTEDQQDTREVVWAVYALGESERRPRWSVFDRGERWSGSTVPGHHEWHLADDRPAGLGLGQELFSIGANLPTELLAVGGGICVEHTWLVSSLLRALNVPARSMSGALEFWAQTSENDGVWGGVEHDGRQNAVPGDGWSWRRIRAVSPDVHACHPCPDSPRGLERADVWHVARNPSLGVRPTPEPLTA